MSTKVRSCSLLCVVRSCSSLSTLSKTCFIFFVILCAGQWENDQKCGHGVFRFASGNKYEGLFKANVRNGYGVYKHANGNTYQARIVLSVLIHFTATSTTNLC